MEAGEVAGACPAVVLWAFDQYRPVFLVFPKL